MNFNVRLPMTIPALLSVLVIFTITLFTGCNGMDIDAYWRCERYMLIAIDARSQMNLVFDEDRKILRSLIGPTIYSIGADEKYIVVKQHPKINVLGDYDRLITNYFIVERTNSTSFSDRKKFIRGPLTREEYKKLAMNISLPDFTVTFQDLE